MEIFRDPDVTSYIGAPYIMRARLLLVRVVSARAQDHYNWFTGAITAYYAVNHILALLTVTRH